MPRHWRTLSRCLVLVDFLEIRHLRRFGAKTSRLVMNVHGSAFCFKTYGPPRLLYKERCLGGDQF